MSEATAIARVEDYKPPPDRLSLNAWFARDIPAPDFLLGEILSTTSRMEIIGATGIGKSNFLIALGMAVADGGDFLHWRGYGEPRRVLFVDGEMSRRLLKRRLEDGVRRRGITPATFLALSREDFPTMEPLNTEGGQRFFDGVIRDVEGIDLVIFDNIQALLSGDMKDEEPWQNTLPWVRDLTRRSIGQIWAHHTGHDTSHGYGKNPRMATRHRRAHGRSATPGCRHRLRAQIHQIPRAHARQPLGFRCRRDHPHQR
jgi:RecA-family ATPase